MTTPLFDGGSFPPQPEDDPDYEKRYKEREDRRRLERKLKERRERSVKSLTAEVIPSAQEDPNQMITVCREGEPPVRMTLGAYEAEMQVAEALWAERDREREIQEILDDEEDCVDLLSAGPETELQPENEQMQIPDNVELRSAPEDGIHPNPIHVQGDTIVSIPRDADVVPGAAVYFEQLLEVVTLQYNLSFKLAGPDWLEAVDRVDTSSAMRVEAGELMESAGYKSWWSKEPGVIDADNCVVEIVDIFHFLIQGLLQAHYARVSLLPQYIMDPSVLTERPAITRDQLLQPVAQFLEEGLTSQRLSVHETKRWTSVRAANKWLGKMLLDGPRASMPYFWAMCAKYEISPELLISMYSAKNALNSFRKDNNYKGDMEGREPYRKIWADGREDNAHVMGRARELASGGTTLTVSMMYEVIFALYNEHSGGTAVRP